MDAFPHKETFYCVADSLLTMQKDRKASDSEENDGLCQGPDGVEEGESHGLNDHAAPGENEPSEAKQTKNGVQVRSQIDSQVEDDNQQQNISEQLSDHLVDMDFNVDDLYEMVMAFKCRQCSFLAQDKSTIIMHIRHRHVSGGDLSGIKRHRHKSNNNNHHHNNGHSTQDEVIENVGFDVSKIKMHKKEVAKEEPVPSMPPTPEAFFPMSDEEEDEEEEEDSCQHLNNSMNQTLEDESNSASRRNHEHITDSMDRDPMEMDDVFLCAECDIVFASKELCCRHMHGVHSLTQFNAEFIQQVIISKKPGEEEETIDEDRSDDDNNETCSKPTKTETLRTRKIVKPPKKLTLEEGALVPRRYRVAKGISYLCSKCLIKYESEEIKMLHENCHIVDHAPRDNGNGTKSGNNKSFAEKFRSEENDDDEDEDSLEQEEVDHQLEEGKNNRNTTDGDITEYKFKCPICLADSKSEDSPNKKEPDGLKKQATILKYFKKWSNCAGHLWREHQIDCELYSCTVCKKFKNYYITKVKDHERLHKPEANYACNTCNKKFKQRHQLTTHQKYHKDKATRLPPPIDSRWYTPKECHICKRVLSDAKCLKKHISAVHNKLKPYCCNICGHMTARKAELRLHIRQHTGEKPFKCTNCTFVTGDHNSLRKHKLRHGNQRPYACPYCDYRCIQSSAFKKHMVCIHPDQDVVIFQCHLCPHASVNETLASSHAKDHEEGRIASTSSKHHSQNDNSADNNENDNSNSSSSSNEYPEIGIRSFGRWRPSIRKPKSPQKRWLDDDSVDVIDTGGVTIPASPIPVITDNCLSQEAVVTLNSSSGSSLSQRIECCRTPVVAESSHLEENPPPGPSNVLTTSSDSTNDVENEFQPQPEVSIRNGMEDLITVNLDDIA